MNAIKKFNNIMGIAFVAVAVIYWFDLDDKMIKKSEPMLRKMAALRKLQKSMM